MGVPAPGAAKKATAAPAPGGTWADRMGTAPPGAANSGYGPTRGYADSPPAPAARSSFLGENSQEPLSNTGYWDAANAYNALVADQTGATAPPVGPAAPAPAPVTPSSSYSYTPPAPASPTGGYGYTPPASPYPDDAGYKYARRPGMSDARWEQSKRIQTQYKDWNPHGPRTGGSYFDRGSGVPTKYWDAIHMTPGLNTGQEPFGPDVTTADRLRWLNNITGRNYTSLPSYMGGTGGGGASAYGGGPGGGPGGGGGYGSGAGGFSPSGLPGLPGQDGFAALAQQLAQATYDRGYNMLEPRHDRDRSQMMTDLANRGLPTTSEAYTGAQDRLDRSQNQALENLTLESVGAGRQEQERLARLVMAMRGQKFGEQATGYGLNTGRMGTMGGLANQRYGLDTQRILGQGGLDLGGRRQDFGEYQYGREQPFREMGWQQNFARGMSPQPYAPPYPQTGAAPNYAQLSQNAYQGNMNAYNQKNQGMMDFGLGLGGLILGK